MRMCSGKWSVLKYKERSKIMENIILIILAVIAGVLVINKKANISEKQKRKNYIEYKKAKKNFDEIMERMKKE